LSQIAITAPKSDIKTHSPDELYINLLQKCLTRAIFQRRPEHRQLQIIKADGLISRTVLGIVRKLYGDDVSFARPLKHEPAVSGKEGETLINSQRMENLKHCVTDVLRRRIPGDLIETGVWRGGASIFMRGILKAYSDRARKVWVADSFQGLPMPNAERYPADRDSTWHKVDFLKVDLETVKDNFARYGLLDDQVEFLPGWFKDTLPTAKIHRLAVMRLDGDMYESTIDALQYLYPKLSIGGYVIVDDYPVPECRAAVEDYRAKHDIKEPIVHKADGIWQRLRALLAPSLGCEVFLEALYYLG
jgi:O-methyltransferase